MKYDILIKGGRVIDPSRGIDAIQDILIEGDRIVPIERGQIVEADQVINADGCLVMPGLIDFHSHLFNGGTEIGIIPDAIMLPNGVTTAVDAGSAGASNYEAFSRNVIANSAVRIKSFINVSTTGLSTLMYHENVDPQYFNVKRTELLLKKYKGEILGLKIRLSKEIVGEHGIEPLKRTVEIAGELGCPVVVHVTNPPVDMSQIAKILRKNDVIVHAYHGTGYTILGDDGKVLPAIKEARQRGVIFDVGAGRTHISFKVAQPAIAENFLPDIISTDMVRFSMLRRPVFAVPYVMSQYLNLGISINDVVKACTATPANVMNMSDEIGTLKPGACADISIMRLANHPVEYVDSFGDKFNGEKLLIPQLTIRAGHVVFRQIDFF